MPVPSPFHDRTAALCTSMRWKEWAGYFAVCSYESHHDPEYFAFRNGAGLLDVSPLFKYELTGPDAARFAGYVGTRDFAGLKVGRVGYTCFCDEHGKVIDDGTVARLDEGRLRLTTASPAFRWFERNARGFDVAVRDVSEATAALALQGPRSGAVLESAGVDVSELRFFGVMRAELAGATVEITRTGYTGDLGYEIWLSAENALGVWDVLIEAGTPHGLSPVGLDALDVTRVEAGFVLHGVDYFSAPHCLIESRKSSPFEIGLGWTVKLDRDAFVGSEALRAEQRRGSLWQLVGLEIDWAGLEKLYERYLLPPALPTQACRSAFPVFSGRKQVGQVTSSAWSPLLKKYLALATVRTGHHELGTELSVEHTVEYERRTVSATVVDRPFFDPERKRA